MSYLRTVQHYETGFEDGRRQAQSDRQGRDLMTTLFSLFFKLFSFTILISPGIFSAYFILGEVKSHNSHLTGWTFVWTFVAVVFVVECMVFFLKGCGISLRKRNNIGWIFPWAICAFYGFVLPVYAIHVILYDWFKPAPGHPTGTLNLIAWIVAVLMGIYIYSRFKFKRASVPLWTT